MVKLESGVNWLNSSVKENEQTMTWDYKYIHAYYFSIVTTITVGYGDITPVN
jgi:hypothetical protein